MVKIHMISRGKSRVVKWFIAGDDDKHLERTHGINPGRSKAIEAAKAEGGKLLLPSFAPIENSYPAILETVTPEKFRNGELSEKQKAAIAEMKQYTDSMILPQKACWGGMGSTVRCGP